METMTTDRLLKFVIEDYSNIKSLEGVLDLAKVQLPNVVRNKVRDILLGMKKELPNVNFNQDDDFIWWYDEAFYKEDEESGLWFGFDLGDLDWEYLTTTEREHKHPFYLYLSVPGKKGTKAQQIDKWMQRMKAHRTVLEDNNIVLEPHKADSWFGEDSAYLLAYYPVKEIHIDKLKDAGEFRKGVQRAAKKFTDVVLKVLRQKKITKKRKR